MGGNVTIALITAIAGITGVILSYIANSRRERIEERRTRHEENRWMLELINKFEYELFQKRLATYPEVFALLGRLSSHSINRLDTNSILEITEKLHEYCYGEVSLCMLQDTREALVDLRNLCREVAAGEAQKEDLRLGPRTRLLELMRRDLSYKSKYHGSSLEEVIRSRGLTFDRANSH